MLWLAQAPSNIALIKYMGKKDTAKNIPANPSLSYTLSKLLTTVELESTPLKKDRWEPLDTPGSFPFTMGAMGQQRFIDHLQRIKDHYDYQGHFIIRSCNNFPHSSGLASSASSFAALTKCAIIALSELTGKPVPELQTQISLSRQGSGSSCRSFYHPWALWHDEVVEPVDLPYKRLIHQVIVVSHGEKKVLSSKAHELIKTSPHFEGRVKRAKDNLKQLLDALTTQNWQQAYQVCWHEFQDMHKLFTTATPNFEYMTAETKSALEVLEHHWQTHGDGPLVTMDAGPNIHLLYREDQAETAMQFKHDHLLGNYDVL